MLKFKYILWLSVLSLPLALYYSSFFAPLKSESTNLTLIFFYIASLGHFFIYFFIISLLILPFLFIKNKLSIFFQILILSLAFVILAIDSHLFSLYRFHLNLAMLDLFFNGGDVIELSTSLKIRSFIEIACLILYAFFIIYLAKMLNKFKVRYFVLTALFCLIFANLNHAYSNAKNLINTTDFINRLPLFKPLTANNMMLRLGLISKDELHNNKISLSKSSVFDYPKEDLIFDENKKKPLNILLIINDSLRFDMLNETNMPLSYAFSKNALVFKNHYSSSNSTRGGIFGLFYGISPNYWHASLNAGTIPALLQSAYKNDYKLGVFTSASLNKPEFYKNIFNQENNLRFGSKPNPAYLRDEECISDFKEFLTNLKDNERFFSFIFFDNIHGFSFPPDFKTPFNPYIPKPNQLNLKNDEEKTKFFNLYQNAVYYADTNINKLLELLKEKNLDKNTIIIISSDHGEEFDDNKKGFFGHNGNFTDTQIKIPLIVKHPLKQGQEIDTLSTAYDIPVTLMQEVFGVKNNPKTYSLGQNLFNLTQREYFIAGSYLENAIIEKDRIILINKLGVLSFKDINYSNHANIKNRQNIFKALQDMNEFLK
ncbi:sulfatase-like hydrolase/transferase [Campylobacter sp. LR291e]|uniref:sulfatase-like hydrolase/transferase n=1 Tax=Campylobacter sp. LR291e TaxID=2593546 RepID=UPI00123BB2DC|nr:sulfatase-like hydrolase/transferase [Campylobacter sp. LR291e]KAA6230701.1 sulfatase-like hydrolase/transferase [Campylobacter sp. LR291e]